jgi:hypothetical protein
MTPQIPTSRPAMVPPTVLTAVQFHTLAAIPPALEWLTTLAHQRTHRAYRQDIQDCMAWAPLDRTEQRTEVTPAQAQQPCNCAFPTCLSPAHASLSGLIITKESALRYR